jgi:hypothetical protein
VLRDGLAAAIVAAAAATLFAMDRLLAFAVTLVAGRRIGAALQATAPARLRLTGALIAPQLVSGRYRRIGLELPDLRAGGLTLTGVTAVLADVRAPLVRTIAGGEVVIGGATAAATIPFASLSERLPAGLAFRPKGADLRISGVLGLMPVRGTVAISAEARRIVLTPKAAGVPSLVGFAVDLHAMPPGMTITSALVRAEGLEFGVHGTDIRVRSETPHAADRGREPHSAGRGR